MQNLRTLPALVAAAALAALPLVSLADDDHRGQNQPYPYATAYPCGTNPNGSTIYCNPNTRNGRNGKHDDEDDNDQGRGNAHNCVNPAGHERGWCKNGRNGNYNNNGGYYNGNGAYNGQTSTIQGVVTGVRGNTVSVLQGLSTISFDASQALQRGYTNGPLYVSRSITAYGYYDGNGTFHATQIR